MDEGTVADDVAVLVVDLLEVVDVEGGEGDRPAVAAGVGQFARGVLIEPAPVEQAGKRIGPSPRCAAARAEPRCETRARARRSRSRWWSPSRPPSGRGRRSAAGSSSRAIGFAHSDAGHDRDRATPPEEDRRPQHRQRVEDGPIAGPGRRGQRVRDQGHAERSDQRQPPPRQARTDGQQETNSTSTKTTGTNANLGSPGRNPSIKPSSAGGAGHCRRRVGHSRRLDRMSSSDETTAEISAKAPESEAPASEAQRTFQASPSELSGRRARSGGIGHVSRPGRASSRQNPGCR